MAKGIDTVAKARAMEIRIAEELRIYEVFLRMISKVQTDRVAEKSVAKPKRRIVWVVDAETAPGHILLIGRTMFPIATSVFPISQTAREHDSRNSAVVRPFLFHKAARHIGK